jgi:hypothetical protein
MLIVLMACVMSVAACGQAADSPVATVNPAGPTAGFGSASAEAQAAGAKTVEVPFHSELTWAKEPGNEIALCTHPLPEGKVYLQRNTNKGMAVSTHLGTGAYENHTCVYGTLARGPEGWFADIRWTAANGDVLLATSDFLYWTGQPGRSVAVDKVTFQDGGTGRFQFAEGEGMAYVNAPERTATYDGTLRYGKREK